MASPTGFIDFQREETEHRPVQERIQDWREIDLPMLESALGRQAARCMDCGIPFCHGSGCPVRNHIPEFNDLVYRGRWRQASENLHSTNNFPEITGRVCPAPCEAACTLSINNDPVTIKHIEHQIVERAFREGWIVPRKPAHRTGKRVAVVGSGPAGLAAAQQLTRAGHEVVVFEKDELPGGLLRFGIPDFKLEKGILDRRIEQMLAEGTKFDSGVTVGQDISSRYLRRTFHAVLLAMGAGQPRTLTAAGSDLLGIHLAMDYLTEQNRATTAGRVLSQVAGAVHAKDKHVVVIGGGDTGSDCVGTAIRQGAASVTQLEILPRPPLQRDPQTPWPLWPQVLRTSSSQQEGCVRRWSVLSKEFSGDGFGNVRRLHGCEVQWRQGPKGWEMKETPGTEFTLDADLVLLAMGFIHVVHRGLIEQLGVEVSPRGNVVVRQWHTTQEGVFAAGDTVRGASLVVHAIHEGRLAAAACDLWLKNPSR